MLHHIRTALFWIHLALGVAVGLFILIMSVSGTLIAFEKQIIERWEEKERYVSIPQGGKALEPEAQIAAFVKARPGTPVGNIVFYSNPALATRLIAGQRPNTTIVYLNPYTGEVNGEGSKSVRRLFAWLIQFHRWFALPQTPVFAETKAEGESVGATAAPAPVGGGEGRERGLTWQSIGKTTTGVSVLAFLAIIITGLFIWLPRRWTWRALKPITAFDPKLTSKARDWNWHNVLGIWSAPVILFVALTGAIIAHRWANNLLYTMTGSPLPQARGGGAGAEGQQRQPGQAQSQGAQGPRAEAAQRTEGGGERRQGGARTEGGPGHTHDHDHDHGPARERRAGTEGGVERRAPRPEGASPEASAEPRGEGRRPRGDRAEGPGGEAPRGGAAQQQGGGSRQAGKPYTAGLNTTFPVAASKVQGWTMINTQLSERQTASITYTIDRGNGTQPYLTDSLTLNRTTGAEEKWVPFASKSAGDQLRGWVRYGHTGEAFGIVGQIIAFIASGACAVLVYTGLMLTWRRFFGKHISKPVRAAAAKGPRKPGATPASATAPSTAPGPVAAAEPIAVTK
ncbi:hypothetical protein DB346_06975 [Verrucomicrobia bacterium LW23]|nr:hypothetical protein DB346_06975 [Verrucomicrobia bacterium LW23]